ncbi:MFS multidrug transporter [Colletotrichum tofieldiae]|nr:MFS multidrug transporter [Colletotrichum tofieldiae]
MTIIAGAIPLEKRPRFYINLPVGGVAGVLLILIKIPELTVKGPFTLSLVKKTIPEIDLIGFALFTPASTMFLLALQFGGNDYPWNSSVVIGLFCGAGYPRYCLWYGKGASAIGP